MAFVGSLSVGFARSAVAQVVPPPDDPDFGTRPWHLAPPGVSPEPRPPSPAPPHPPQSPTELRWYGYQTALVDVGGVSLLPANPAFGFGVLALGGPTLHAAHGRPVAAGASLGLRVGLPLYVAATQRRCDRGQECWGQGLAIFGAFALGALVDITVLSWEEVPRRTSATSVRVAPTFSVSPGGGAAGLAGTF